MKLRPLWHGTAGGYTNHRCRCIPCRKAGSALQKIMRQNRMARRLAERLSSRDEMAAYRDSGCTLQCIGTRYHLTRQRIHQILSRSQSAPSCLNSAS